MKSNRRNLEMFALGFGACIVLWLMLLPLRQPGTVKGPNGLVVKDIGIDHLTVDGEPLEHRHAQPITAIGIAPNGKWLLSGDKAGYLALWYLPKREFRRFIWSPSPIVLHKAGDDEIQQIIVTPDSQWAMVSGRILGKPVISAVSIPFGSDFDFDRLNVSEIGEYAGAMELLAGKWGSTEQWDTWNRDKDGQGPAPSDEAIRKWHQRRVKEIKSLTNDFEIDVSSGGDDVIFEFDTGRNTP